MARHRRVQQGKFLRWSAGRKGCRVLIDALHATPPGADEFTGVIAESAAQKLGAHCIVATVSRSRSDLNRSRCNANAQATDEYRSIISQLLVETGLLIGKCLQKPILHISIHGMTNRHGYDIEIGTRRGETSSEDVSTLVVETLQQWAKVSRIAPQPKVVKDQRFIGDGSKKVPRCGDDQTEYEGYGSNFNTIQIELANWLRCDHRDALIEALVAVGEAFERGFEVVMIRPQQDDQHSPERAL